MDSFQTTGLSGIANGIVSINPSTGIANWIRFDGLPNSSAHFSTPERMCLDSQGNIYCTGSCQMCIFGADTLTEANGSMYLTKYDNGGTLLSVREFTASGGANAFGISADPFGGVLITGAYSGTASFDGFTPTAQHLEMYVSRHDSAGICTAFVTVQRHNWKSFSLFWP